MSTAAPDAPAPLRLPAILQNPQNTALRQVEAYNAQQREKAQARRVARQQPRDVGDHSGRGKRVVRRLDNAQFVGNPHVVAPKRSDYYPSVPLHPRPARGAFPPSAIPRTESIPSATVPERDPFSSSSQHGAFSTSLKGTRALLRKRSGGGRRTEELVGRVEASLRSWLEGEGVLDGWSQQNGAGEHWAVIDEAMVDLKETREQDSAQPEPGPSSPHNDRRLPARHHVTDELLPLPHRSEGGSLQVPAVLEHSRSAAHLTWAVADSFDRLVVHLVARYYELNSWSEEAAVTGGSAVRLTHIVRPALTRPNPAGSHALLTPETSDVSDLSSESESSASERASAGASDSEPDLSTDGDDTETETERGSVFGDEGTGRSVEYSLEPDSDIESDAGAARPRDRTVTPGLSRPLDDLHFPSDRSDSGVMLHRTISNTSSAYASSEGGASDYSALGDSLTFSAPEADFTSSPSLSSGADGANGWVSVQPGDHPIVGSLRSTRFDASLPRGFVSRRGWEEKPSFLEYLYGS